MKYNNGYCNVHPHTSDTSDSLGNQLSVIAHTRLPSPAISFNYFIQPSPLTGPALI